MTTTSLPRLPTDTSLERAIIAFNTAMEELDYQLGGFLDYRNISRFANFAVNKDDLKHQSGVVGISGADPSNPEAIRFYSGDDIDGEPNWKVTQAGIMTAVAAVIMSAAGYPRITLNQNSNLLQAFSDADNHVDMTAVANTAPGLAWTVDGEGKAYLQCGSFGVSLATFDGTGITLQPAGDLNLLLNSSGNITVGLSAVGQTATIPYVKNIVPDGFGGFTANNGTLTFTKGILTSYS